MRCDRASRIPPSQRGWFIGGPVDLRYRTNDAISNRCGTLRNVSGGCMAVRVRLTSRPKRLSHLAFDFDLLALYLLRVGLGLFGWQIAFHNHLEGHEDYPHVRPKRCFSNVPL